MTTTASPGNGSPIKLDDFLKPTELEMFKDVTLFVGKFGEQEGILTLNFGQDTINMSGDMINAFSIVLNRFVKEQQLKTSIFVNNAGFMEALLAAGGVKNYGENKAGIETPKSGMSISHKGLDFISEYSK